MRDVSIGGAFIATSDRFAYGESVIVHVHLPGLDSEIAISSTVRWVNKDGCGVQFGVMGVRETHALVHQAMAQSCNVYFYHLAEKVGLERMAKMAMLFGLGQPTGLSLGETPGFVPTLEFYKKNGGFRGGYALNTALGQGAVRATVLQMALLYAALGNGGKLYQPMLVDRVEKPSGEVVEQHTETPVAVAQGVGRDARARSARVVPGVGRVLRPPENPGPVRLGGRQQPEHRRETEQVDGGVEGVVVVLAAPRVGDEVGGQGVGQQRPQRGAHRGEGLALLGRARALMVAGDRADREL